nr:WRKY7833 [Atractylodes chinensis]
MDSACVFEQKTVIHELTQGIQMAKQLRANLDSAEARDFLIHKILSSYENALSVLKTDDSATARMPWPSSLPPPTLSESSGSPQSGQFEFDQPFIDQQGQNVVSKKRKASTAWEDQVRICSDIGLEGNTNDGYSWRKYGQKDILGAKFPRSYYRCTYRKAQNCLATKQVQRTDEDPTVFEIAYKGKHTCNHGAQSGPPPPPSPDKHEINPTHHHQPSSSNPSEMLSNLRSNLSVNTLDSTFSFPSTPFGFLEDYQQLDFPNHFDAELLQGYSPPFISESNYLTDWGSLNFPTDPADVVPNFKFNDS